MNKDTKIYICTHTDFVCPVTNPVYEIADARQLFEDDKSPNGMDNLFYSELATYQHIAENYKLPKYVGFCHYRKFFDFMDDVPDLEALVEEYGCVATHPVTVKWTVERHYDKCFNFADLDIMKALLYERKPTFYLDFVTALQDNNLYTANMFVMRRNDFKQMMRFVWDMLGRWLDVVGYDVKRRILDHPDIYLSRKGRGGTLSHQFRIGGNLGERIISAYIKSKFPEAKTFGITFTEEARPHKEI